MNRPLAGFVFSEHAIMEMKRRGIDKDVVASVLGSPEHRQSVRPGRDVLQSRLQIDGKTYLVRVVVDTNRQPPEVVTVYRTSKIGKYWRAAP